MRYLLTTVPELTRYVAVDFIAMPEELLRALQAVQLTVIEPLLGRELTQWLSDARPAVDLDTDDTLAAELLRLVQAPLAHLAAAHALPELQVQVDNTGVHIVSTDTHKTAFQWQKNDLEAAWRRQGEQELDVLVQWLEDNYESDAQLQAWATSPAGQRHRRGLFTSTAELQEVVDINQSRAVFVALQPILRNVTVHVLESVLSSAFLQELLDQVRTRQLTAENENLLRSYVRPALGNLAVARAIPGLGLGLSGTGVELRVARFDDSNAKESDASADQLLGLLKRQLEANGIQYLDRLRDYLNRTAAADKFATYFTSPAYVAPAPPAPVPTDRRIHRFS